MIKHDAQKSTQKGTLEGGPQAHIPRPFEGKMSVPTASNSRNYHQPTTTGLQDHKTTEPQNHRTTNYRTSDYRTGLDNEYVDYRTGLDNEYVDFEAFFFAAWWPQGGRRIIIIRVMGRGP